MNVLVSQAIIEVDKLIVHVPVGKHVCTGDIRKLAAKLYKKIDDKRIDNVLSLCEELLEKHRWELDVIAFDWAYRVKAQYNEHTYEVFFYWLKQYVRGGEIVMIFVHMHLVI